MPEEVKKKEPEQGQQLSAADTIVVGLAQVYSDPFSVILNCKPDIEKGIVNVELKESYKEEK